MYVRNAWPTLYPSILPVLYICFVGNFKIFDIVRIFSDWSQKRVFCSYKKRICRGRSCLMDMLHVSTDNINVLEQKQYYIYVVTYALM